MKKTTGFYPSVQVDTAPVSAAGSAGGVLLTTAAEVTGLSPAMARALDGWRKPAAVHHPAKVLTDLAVTLALGDLPTLPGEADGGVLTPAVALGAPYAERLRQHGVTLEVTKLG